MPASALAVSPAECAIILNILEQLVPGREVWAFGSRARGAAKPHSDLDLVIITERPPGLEASAALAEAFSESDLPYKVDVVDWATASDAFRSIIARDKMVIRARPAEWPGHTRKRDR